MSRSAPSVLRDRGERLPDARRSARERAPLGPARAVRGEHRERRIEGLVELREARRIVAPPRARRAGRRARPAGGSRRGNARSRPRRARHRARRAPSPLRALPSARTRRSGTPRRRAGGGASDWTRSSSWRARSAAVCRASEERIETRQRDARRRRGREERPVGEHLVRLGVDAHRRAARQLRLMSFLPIPRHPWTPLQLFRRGRATQPCPPRARAARRRRCWSRRAPCRARRTSGACTRAAAWGSTRSDRPSAPRR